MIETPVRQLFYLFGSTTNDLPYNLLFGCAGAQFRDFRGIAIDAG